MRGEEGLRVQPRALPGSRKDVLPAPTSQGTCMPWYAQTRLHRLSHLSANCMGSHSLTQFCQSDLVNLNAFNRKLSFKPNYFDRAGLGHCSRYSSTNSNANLRGSCSPLPPTCQLHVSHHPSPFSVPLLTAVYSPLRYAI